MKNKKLKMGGAVTMLGATLIPIITTSGIVFAQTTSSSSSAASSKDAHTTAVSSSSSATAASSSSAAANSSHSDAVTANAGQSDSAATQMKQVVSVNGHKLLKDEAVKAGDTVTWDIVATPGNEGLMQNFSDTLPNYLKFDPDSEYAVTVFAVNNDGTVGQEITKDGTGKIDGQTYTWTPKTPVNYIYVGSQGKTNRLLFHITAKVVGDTPANKDLINHATLTTTHKKVSDSAKVHTTTPPKNPSIHKSVFAEDANGNLVIPKSDSKDQSALPSDQKTTQAAADKQAAADINKGTDQSINTKMNDSDFIKIVNDLINLGKAHGIDVHQLVSDVNDANGKQLTEEQKAHIMADYKATAQQLDNLSKTLKNNSTTTDTKGSTTQLAKNGAVVAGNDSLDLQTHDSLYGYVLDINIPPTTVKQSLVIKDPLEHVQHFNQSDVHIYDASGKDITSEGTVSVQNKESKRVSVLWTAKPEFVNQLKKARTDTHLKEVIKNVTLKGDNAADEQEYLVGGRVTVPNKADLITDGKDTPSNETVVRPPVGNEGPSTIQKGVMLEGSNDNGGSPAVGAGQANASSQGAADASSNVSKSAATADTNGFHAWFGSDGKFNAGQTQETLPQHDSVYRYLINTSIRPSDVTKTLVIDDPLENVQSQSVKADNVRVYDITGKDVTKDFKVTVGQSDGTHVDVKATADQQITNYVHSQHQNVQYQMVINHVSLKGDNSKDEARYQDGSGQVRVPNVASLLTDKGKLDSNKTEVMPPKSPANPQNPANPGTPGTPGEPGEGGSDVGGSPASSPGGITGNIKTGLEHLAASPWSLLVLIAAIVTGSAITAKEIHDKRKHNDEF